MTRTEITLAMLVALHPNPDGDAAYMADMLPTAERWADAFLKHTTFQREYEEGDARQKRREDGRG